MNHRLTINPALYLCAMKILMVCLGNICRSPLAEGILQKKAEEAGLNWIIESAGTNSYHIGQPPHQFSQKVAKLNGIDISCQKARKFMAQDFERYDKIYAMAKDVVEDIRSQSGGNFNENKLDLFLNELHPGQNRDVPDPWYGDEEGYHEVYALIEETCDAILENYFATHPDSSRDKVQQQQQQ
jgi:protein-tyrosine phosphatase